MTVQENPFRKALEWLGPDGERWRKDSAGCAHRAVVGLHLPRDVDRAVSDLLDEAARSLFPDRASGTACIDAANVNDHPDTTFDDIRTIFEKAAVRWEERI